MKTKINKTFTITPEEIVTICKCKHYRFGREGVGNYDQLQRLLRALGMKEEDIARCLHP